MQLFERLETSQALFLAGLVLFILGFVARRRRRPAESPGLPSVPGTSGNAVAQSGRSALGGGSLIDPAVQLHELGREISSRIDAKLSALQHLIRLADEATAGLEQALHRARDLGLAEFDRGSEAGRDQDGEVQEAMWREWPMAEPPRGGMQDASGSRDRGMISLETDRSLDRATDASPRTAVRARGTGWSADELENPRFERIYALADGGLSATRIAAQTGTQIGEVELVLSLRGKRQAS